jgi:hypothetical protein
MIQAVQPPGVPIVVPIVIVMLREDPRGFGSSFL